MDSLPRAHVTCPGLGQPTARFGEGTSTSLRPRKAGAARRRRRRRQRRQPEDRHDSRPAPGGFFCGGWPFLDPGGKRPKFMGHPQLSSSWICFCLPSWVESQAKNGVAISESLPRRTPKAMSRRQDESRRAAEGTG